MKMASRECMLHASSTRRREAPAMLYAGLDLSRMHLASGCSTREARRWMGLRCRPDADGLRGLAGRVACFAQPVRAASESMNCARFVHDQLEGHCCDVEIADALKPEDDMPSAAEHLVTRGARCGRLRLPVGEVRRRGRVDARAPSAHRAGSKRRQIRMVKRNSATPLLGMFIRLNPLESGSELSRTVARLSHRAPRRLAAPGPAASEVRPVSSSAGTRARGKRRRARRPRPRCRASGGRSDRA